MPTEKPRFTITVPEDMYERINAHWHENRFRSQSQAINDLIERGLKVLGIGLPEEEPVTTDGLTDDERDFIALFDDLTPTNQRLLLGIGAVILQEQQRPPD